MSAHEKAIMTYKQAIQELLLEVNRRLPQGDAPIELK
jgi:hypothetical protein